MGSGSEHTQNKNNPKDVDQPCGTDLRESSGGVASVIVERFEVRRKSIEFTGWAHCPGETLRGISIQRAKGTRVEALQTRLRRPDIAARIPGSSAALLSGFACHVAIDRVLDPRLRIVFFFSGGCSFQLKMSRTMTWMVWDRFFRGAGHRYLGWVKPLKRWLMPPLKASTNSPSGISVVPVRQRYDRTLTAEVILPVYNGLHHIERLLPKLCADPQISRLWIVDDASTDSEVTVLLDRAAAASPQVILLRNQANQGFVKSVNQALRQTEEDCVILNTDVDVPAGWITRLLEPIRDDASIASTTPFSNCGTILSFPSSCKDNHVFDDLDVDKIDRHFRTFRPHGFLVEVPTGVGFCMAMSRLAIGEIGHFDEELFGDGYGEENDWCRRAVLRGFRHVAVPNLYVYHAHGGSFRKEDKQRLLERNLKRLAKRHPSYHDAVQTFIKQDPLKMHRDLAALKVLAHECSSDVAVTIDHDRGGGANSFRELVVRDAVSSGGLSLIVAWRVDKGGYILHVKHTMASFAFAIPDADDLFDVLGSLPVTQLHVNSLVFTPDVAEMLGYLSRYAKRDPGIKVTFYLHDYHCICPSHNLMNHRGVFCGLPSTEECNRCLSMGQFATARLATGIVEWRDAWALFLKSCHVVRAFSAASAKIFISVFPELSERVDTQGHRVRDMGPKVVPSRSRGPVVGVVGHINHAKGGAVVTELARRGAFPVVLLGKFFLTKGHPKHLTIHGKYDVSELPELITRYGINVGLVPSVWPETYNFVADELMSLGLPVVCFDVGAHAERVRAYEFGQVLPLQVKDDTASLAESIKRVYEKFIQPVGSLSDPDVGEDGGKTKPASVS